MFCFIMFYSLTSRAIGLANVWSGGWDSLGAGICMIFVYFCSRKFKTFLNGFVNLVVF